MIKNVFIVIVGLIDKTNGIRNGKQKYKCHSCGVQFLRGIFINPSCIWDEYNQRKQTYKQLANKYNCSKRTIKRKIDQHTLTTPV